MDLDELYLLVTDAILRADTLADLGAPGAAAAYLDVSLLEERIATLLPPSDAEGMIARRGAVRAAITAGERFRAWELVSRYRLEHGATEQMWGDVGPHIDDLGRDGFPSGPKVTIEGEALISMFVRLRAAGEYHQAAEVAYAGALLSDGDDRSKWKALLLRELESADTETIAGVQSSRLEIAGIQIPELLHEGVVQHRPEWRAIP